MTAGDRSVTGATGRVVARPSDALLAALVVGSYDAIICIDAAQRIVEFNQGAERMFLRTRDAVLGQPLELLIPERFRAAHATYLEGYAASGVPRRMASDRPTVRGVRSNGEEFTADATIARHELDGLTWFSVIVRDLDARARSDVGHERRWRELFEAASDGIFIADLEGRFGEVNAAGCLLLGYRRDELVGKHILDTLPAESAERLAETRRQLAAGHAEIGEWELRRKDGSHVPVEISAKILADGRWIAFIRDISDRRAVEAALHLEQQRLRVALTGSPISTYTQDRELRYTWSFNPPRPLTPEDIVGKLEDEVAPAARSHLAEIKRRVIETGSPAREVIRIEVEGTARYLDTTIEPLRDEQDRVIGITGAAWDMTDRKRAEDAQRFFAEVSEKLATATLDWTQLLTNVAPLALGFLADFCVAELIDDAGRIHRHDVVDADPANAALCQALREIELDHRRPRLGFEVFHTREPVLVANLRPGDLAMMTQSEHHLALLRQVGLRSLIAVPLISGARLLGAYLLGSRSHRYGDDDLRIATEFAHRVAVAVDNARLHRAVQQAADARAEVLAIVAHDLRNPLGSILLQAELLASQLEPTAPPRRALDRIRGSARRMDRLIQDLLDVVRLDAHEPLAIELASVAPAAVAEQTLDMLQPQAARSRIELALACDPELPEVRADHHRLVQVLDNLVANAIKFSTEGARIVVGLCRRDREVVFSVADTGPGIPPDQIGHLFDRFWQAERNDRRGTGIGLTVVKAVVEAHGGSIWVDSRVGVGTTFSFTIPTVASAPPPRLDAGDDRRGAPVTARR